MNYIARIIRGSISGGIIVAIAYGTTVLVGNYFFQTSVHTDATANIFIFSILVYTVVFSVWYLWMRRAYCKSQESR